METRQTLSTRELAGFDEPEPETETVSDERREEGLRGRVHPMIVRSGSPATRPRDGLSTTVHRPFTACPRLVTRRPYCPSHA